MNLEQVAAVSQNIAHEYLTKNAPHVDRDAVWPEENLRALQAAGLGGLVVPREMGGLGLGLFGVARVCEILGEVCASTAICFGMHCVGSAVISAKATPGQARRYLDPICRGEHLTTLALSEPGSGIHFYIPQARITDAADGFLIDGVKAFVTNGAMADSYVLSVAAANPSAPGQFACAVLPRGAEGTSWDEPWKGFGMRGNSARNLRLDGAHIGRDDRLGSGDDEIWYVFNVIAPYFLIAMSGTYAGVARAALNTAIEHVGARAHAHSGRRLADQPLVQHRIGELWAKVERTRQLIFEAARQHDAGRPDALVALCSAKAEVATCAVDVTNEAMTLCGGKGYGAESTLHRLLRDARAAHVMAPTTDMLRTWAGRALLGVPLLGE